MEIAAQKSKKSRDMLFATYEKYTKLTKAELERYKSVENSGQLFAKQCLSKHLCDWILMSDGQLIGRRR